MPNVQRLSRESSVLDDETAVTKTGRSFPEIEFLEFGMENGIVIGPPERASWKCSRISAIEWSIAMAVDQKIRDALKLSKLKTKLPKNPRVVEIRVEEYVDTSGEEALRVTVLLDEGVEVEKLKAEDIRALTRAIRKRIREHGIELWPYIQFAKQSELDAEDEE
jgi:hypothetical protein